MLFENLMNQYIGGLISDENKAILFSLVEESELYRKQYDERIKLYALLHVPAFEVQKDLDYKRLKERLHLVSSVTVGRKW